MNSTVKTPFAPSAGTLIRPGVPFSSRLICGVHIDRSPIVIGNRAFVRAWMARRAANVALASRRAR